MEKIKKLKSLLYPVEKVHSEDLVPGMQFGQQQSRAIVVNTPKGRKVVNFCSPQYHLVPNRDIIEPIIEALDGYKLDFVTWNRGDARFSLDILVNDITTEVGNKDKVIPRVRLYNSYDGRLKYQFHMGFFRLICSNGMVIAAEGFEDKNISKKMRHTPSLEKHTTKVIVKDMVESFKDNLDIFKLPFDTLNKQKVGNLEQRVEDVINATKFPSRRTEDVIERVQYEVGQLKKPIITDWLVYNSFNFQLNHNKDIKTDIHKKENIDQQVLSFLLKS